MGKICPFMEKLTFKKQRKYNGYFLCEKLTETNENGPVQKVLFLHRPCKNMAKERINFAKETNVEKT